MQKGKFGGGAKDQKEDEEMLGRFADLLADVDLGDIFPYLLENGFDTWAIVKELNAEILSKLGAFFKTR
jgi:hypothetical protein